VEAAGSDDTATRAPVSTPPPRASREVRSARANRRPPSFIVTLIALVIVFALAWMFFVRSGSSAPPPSVRAIRGTFSSARQSDGATVVVKGAFSAVASGNAGGSEHLAKGEVVNSAVFPESAYDAAARTESTFGGVGPAVSLVRTVGEWPPVWRVATHGPLDYQGLAAIVRTAVEDGDHSVGIKPLKQGDRAVWRAALTMDGKQITLVVDQQTGIVTWCDLGGTTFTADGTWDSPPPAGTTYSVDPPAGTPEKTMTADEVTYAGSPAAAGRLAGYAPLASDLAPDGYALKAVATWPASSYLPLRWISDKVASSATSGHAEPLVAQLYTRGLGWFTMEQLGPQAAKSLGAGLDESTAGAAGRLLSAQETTLQFGAFKGRTALTWYQESGPSLFVSGTRRAVFVTGALTRQELIAFAEGLKPIPADATP
jgi:hypothetical protein